MEIEGRNIIGISVYPDFDIIIMEVGLMFVIYLYIYTWAAARIPAQT